MPGVRYAGLHIALGLYSMSPEHDPNVVDGEDIRQAASRLSRLTGTEFATAHLPATSGIVEMEASSPASWLFVVRDPRDIAVSCAHYIVSLKSHHLRSQFLANFTTEDERILAVIQGFPADDL